MHQSGFNFIYSLALGPAALSWGLLQLREKRRIENTPASKIRSAAMGVVAFNGSAKPRKEIISPVSNLPCCWWRCVVQEYRSNGKSSSWQDIKEMTCPELFYLEDDTAQVLIDPAGGDIRSDEDIFPLDSLDRPRLEIVLSSWGINTAAWFGGLRTIRIKESVIYPESPVYVFGDISHRYDYMEERKQRFMERIQAIKRDPQKMSEAGVVKDGAIDVDAWDAFCHQQEQKFLEEEAAREAQVPESDKLVVRKPKEGPLVIDTRGEKDILSSLGYRAFFGVFGGMGLSGLGVWLAVSNGYSYEVIGAMVAVGLVAGLFVSVLKIVQGGKIWGL